MPVRHYYECSKGHITEHSLPTFEAKVRCHKLLEDGKSSRRCQSLAEVIYISDRKGQNALAFKPIEFYINSAGEIINLGLSLRDVGNLPAESQKKLKEYISELEEKGYSHRELTTIREYESFRKEHNTKLTLQNMTQALGMKESYEDWIRSEIDDLKRGFTMTRQDGSTVSIPPLDKFDHPEVAKLAHDLMENRPLDLSLLEGMDSRIAKEIIEINSSNSTNYSPDFYIDAIENDEGKHRSTWI